MAKEKKKKNPHAVALSKLSAGSGPKAKWAKITDPKERSRIGKHMASFRWNKGKKKKDDLKK